MKKSLVFSAKSLIDNDKLKVRGFFFSENYVVFFFFFFFFFWQNVRTITENDSIRGIYIDHGENFEVLIIKGYFLVVVGCRDNPIKWNNIFATVSIAFVIVVKRIILLVVISVGRVVE